MINPFNINVIDKLTRSELSEPSATCFTPPHRVPGSDTKTLQIRATTGLGKTRAAIRAVGDDPEWRTAEIHYYVPDYELAEEVRRLACEAGFPRVIVMKGRTASSASHGYCARARIADRTAKAGLNVYRACCQFKDKERDARCLHFGSCPYLQQWDDSEPAFRIFVHQYIFLPKPKRDGRGVPEPELQIVDESVLSKAVIKQSFSTDRLEGPYFQAVREHLTQGKDLRSATVDVGISDTDAWQEAELLQSDMTVGLRPNMSDKDAQELLKNVSENERRGLIAFYRALAYEMELGRPFHGIEVRKDEKVKINGCWEHQDRVHVFERRECHLSEGASLLLIDADANRVLNEKVFGDGIASAEIPAEQKAHVIQVYSSSLSTYTLTKPDSESAEGPNQTLQKVGRIVANEVANSKRVLVVMPKKVRSFLESKDLLTRRGEIHFYNGAEVTHFGAIRGKDRWKSCDAIVIVGRHEPPPQVAEEIARALFSEDPEPLEFLPKGQASPRSHAGIACETASISAF